MIFVKDSNISQQSITNQKYLEKQPVNDVYGNDLDGNIDCIGFQSRANSRYSGRLQKIRLWKVLVLTFIIYYFLWIFANWPGLNRPWYYLDDYHKIYFVSSSFQTEFKLGRPIQGLWYLTFNFDGNIEQAQNNIILRFIHGVFHSAAAALAAVIIWNQTRQWFALISVIPFLIWPFNGEAVLWRAAGGYPIAVFLSIMGVFLITLEGKFSSFRKVMGMIFIILSILSNQLAAFAGLILWIILLGVDLYKNVLSNNKFIQLILIIVSYFSGGITSIFLLRHFNPGLERSQFTSDLIAKANLLGQLNKLFISSPTFYSDLTIVLHLILLLGAIVIFLLNVDRGSRNRIYRIISFLTFASLFVIPYITLLVTAENWPTWRVMYLAPFIFTMALNLVNFITDGKAVIRLLPVAILLILTICYIKTGRINSSEYVKVYEEDIRVLQKLNTASDELDIDQVTIAPYPYYIRDWNPYDIDYIFADSKISAFQVAYTWYPLINHFSQLRTVQGEMVKECAAVCNEKVQETSVSFSLIDRNNTLCMCP